MDCTGILWDAFPYYCFKEKQCNSCFAEYITPLPNASPNIFHTDLGIQHIQSKTGYTENYQEARQEHKVFQGHSNDAKFYYKGLQKGVQNVYSVQILQLNVA